MLKFSSLLAGSLLLVCAASAGVPANLHTEVDPSVPPGDDFYLYANNSWLQATKLPDGIASTDSTAMLRALNAQRVRDLVMAAAKEASTHGHTMRADERKIGDYYASRLDVARIEARGMAPLSPDLTAIAAIRNRKELAAQLGRLLRLDDGSNTQTESLWGIWVHQGFHGPDYYGAHFMQGGLGLPDTDDYLSSASDKVARRALYRAYVAAILKQIGFDQADMRAARVLELETAIARTHASRADTDDPFKTDNLWHAADFPTKAPGVDWGAYFAAAGLDPAVHFVVWQPGAVTAGARLVEDAPLDAWKDYLSFHLVDHYVAVLPQTIRDARRAFDAGLAGAASPPPPEPAGQALAATQAMFGDAIGKLYVERYFPPSAKAAAQAMVANIQTAYRDRIANLQWMAPETRAKALAKLAALRVGVGYPESWIDYAPFAVVRGDAFGNLKRGEAFEYRRQIAKLHRAVDPDEWADVLHPQQVGAILNISPNSMEFAAGLLQPPYFDPDGDMASNYGSAGAGLAHEISHSFDEVGNMYDAEGRLGTWWSADDLAHYQAALAPLVAQLDACGHGKQIVGESSADLAGLLAAHDAYLRALGGQPDVVKNGFTGEQRFFIAFAQRWRRLQTDAALHHQIEADTHAPPVCRANQVRNVAAWDQAFDIKPGDKLYLDPPARFQIW